LGHFHASEPHLASFSAPVAAHAESSRALARSAYRGWVALEMRAAPEPLPALREAVRFLRKTYGE
jgi:hypothetical protein